MSYSSVKHDEVKIARVHGKRKSLLLRGFSVQVHVSTVGSGYLTSQKHEYFATACVGGKRGYREPSESKRCGYAEAKSPTLAVRKALKSLLPKIK